VQRRMSFTLRGRRRWLLRAVAFTGGTAWARGLAHAQATAAGRRIVSVGGALTETLYALGAQGDLVGVDTTSLYPDAARALPSVGYARNLSAEGVLSLRPTLVVASEDAGPPAVLRQLEAARVPVVVLGSDHRFEGVLTRTQKLAELSGRAHAGQSVAARLQHEWQTTRERVLSLTSSGKAAPRVLFVLSHSIGQMRVAGRDTSADAMSRYAGAANVYAGVEGGFSGYKPLAPEAAIAAAPDVILATEQGLAAAGGIDGLLRVPGLAQTPAGRARRVVALEALLLLGFGPRLPLAVATLADALHTRA
jgi:iron complex transport system substrate-binding protein